MVSEATLPKNPSIIVERRFTEAKSGQSQEYRPPQPLSAFFNRQAFVVLGDPGSGKTTSFKQAAMAEPAALYVTVRDFLALGVERYRGMTIYLDALDEMRGRAEDGRTVLDQLRGRLDELGCPRFRLSCRAADWYGSSDAAGLAGVSSDGTLAVLNLEPLYEEDIRQIVAAKGCDPRQFLDEARNRGVFELLENPQTLLMFLEVVGDQGLWPRTRAELFQKTTEILVRESNEEHRRSVRTKADPNDLFSASGYLFAAILCGGTEGVALDEGAAGDSFISIQALGGKTPALLSEAARRRLFTAQGPERMVPIHRTVAEYLAANYLCTRVREGLPLNRVLSLVTGHDGGTLSDLRGVFAWLVCLCLQHAESLIPIDPLGVVLYGDVSLLPLSCRRLLLERFQTLSQENPWFRAENHADRPFGALASPEMEPIFRQVLEDPTQHPVAVSCVIDAIRFGYPLPSLGDHLLDLARDGSRLEFLRVDALKAFGSVCAERVSELRGLLEDVHCGRVDDVHCRLRGVLLRRLYPGVVGPAEVNKYLVEEPKSFLGEYSRWLLDEVAATTPPEDIPKLLDSIASCNAEIDKRRRYSYRRFIGKLLYLGLSLFGESLSPERLYAWLGVSLDKYWKVMFEDEHVVAIRQWLDSHPDKIRSLYEHWFFNVVAENLRMEDYKFRNRLFGCQLPNGFSQWLIGLCVTQKDEKKADFLFREGVCLRTIQHRVDAPTLEELFDFVDLHPRFCLALQDETFCQIDNWRWEDIRHSARYKKKNESARAKRIQLIKDHIDEVRTGRHCGILKQLAMAYFCCFSDIDNSLNPRERIVSIANDECAQAGFLGFVAAVKDPPSDAPTVAMVAEASAKSHIYKYGYIVLAGLDLVYQGAQKEFFALPREVLASGLVYHLVMSWDEEREWAKNLIRELPDFSASVFDLFWREHLANKSQHVPKLYTLSCDQVMAEIGRKVALPLLRDFPNCKESDLKDLLLASLIFTDKDALGGLAKDLLLKPGVVKGTRRVLWYGTLFLLYPDEYGQRLQEYIDNDVEKAGVLLSFINSTRSETRTQKLLEISISTYGELISICGRVFRPEGREAFEEEEQDWSMHRDSSQLIRGMIDQLATCTSGEALDVLKKLRGQPALAPWRDALANASAIQTRKWREESFRYPTVGQVIEVLHGGPPANPADLQALVLDHLRQLRDDIIHGSTDSFKAFWNVDSHGRPISPRPEEDCRDRLLERLRERFRPIGLAAEPEGHYARDKRADIKILYQNTLNLPIEIKRHYHPDLWTAPRKQLQDLYARDPATGGRGVYLVFWFGIAKGRSLPRPSVGIVSPKTPEQLENMLRETIHTQERSFIEIIVLDCSGK